MPTCTRCNDTGEYHGTRRDGSTYVGRCFACQGGGYRRYSRRPAPAYIAPLAMTAAPAGPVPSLGTARGVDALRAFQAVHAREFEWLTTQSAAGVDFANSLLRGLQRYGNLTPRQLAAVQRNVCHVEPVAPVAEPVIGTGMDGQPVTESDVRSGTPVSLSSMIVSYGSTPVATVAGPATVAPVTIDMAQIFAAFDTAATSGLRKVRLTLGTVELKRTGERFRGGAGLVMVYVDGNYKGTVSRDNVFHPGMNRTMSDAELERVRTAVANPRAAAATHGHDTGYCSCCRRLLTDPPSVMAGIGPVCIRRFGWSF